MKLKDHSRPRRISRRKLHSQRTMAKTRQHCVFVRELLFFAMGNHCHNCGSRNNLTMDCIIADGNKGHHGKMSWQQRTNFYWLEFLKENLQPLCLGCNSAKQDKMGVPMSLFEGKFSPYNTGQKARLMAA